MVVNRTPTVHARPTISTSPTPASVAAPAQHAAAASATHPVLVGVVLVVILAAVCVAAFFAWRVWRARRSSTSDGNSVPHVASRGSPADATPTPRSGKVPASTSRTTDGSSSRKNDAPHDDGGARVAEDPSDAAALPVAPLPTTAENDARAAHRRRISAWAPRAAVLLALVLAFFAASTTRGRVLLVLLVIAAACIMAYTLPRVRSVEASKRRERLVEVLPKAFLLFAYPYGVIVSWAYRLEVGPVLVGVLRLVFLYVLAFVSLPIGTQAYIVGGIALVLAEVYFVEIYWIGHRKVWRRFFPDLLIKRAGARGKGELIGRHYKTIPQDDGTFVVLFARKGMGSRQWFKGLQRLVVKERPSVLSKRELVLTASGLREPREEGVWRLVSEPFATVPLSSEGAAPMLKRLQDNSALFAKGGLEANAYHLALKSGGVGASSARGVDDWDEDVTS